MCVACHVRDLEPYEWKVKGFIGGLKNIFYTGRRGEGHPAPWLMLCRGKIGLQVGLSKSRPWLKPEVYKDYESLVKSYMWGIFILAVKE